MTVDGLPETVPARMVNEFVYCPRLFHLEWVQGRFAGSDDVEAGRYTHRVVDVPSGVLPDAGAEMLPGWQARSVWLTSSTLAVSAKLDLVESGPDGEVVPVDYKKGHADRDGRPWPSDVIQSALQVLLLREAGYNCRRAEIWYDESRQRVRLDVDAMVEEQTRQVLADLWAVASRPEPPAPLVDSPKCPRCSLVAICLPDEVNTLLHRQSRPPRRIVPRNPDDGPLYVTEQGASVGVHGGRVEVSRNRDVLVSARLIDVSQVNIYGNVSVSAYAMRQFFAREVPVCWFSYGGWFTGLAEGLPGKHVDLRRAQVLAASGLGLAVARALVAGKIRNCRTLLRRNARGDVARIVAQLAALAGQATDAVNFAMLLGIEGTAARLYFQAFSTMVSADCGVRVADFDTDGRTRRPPRDPLNAVLSFVYALLVKDLTVTAYAVGFDPYLGVYHRPRYGRPALALDLAEEFRPLVGDSVAVQVLNNGEVTDRDFRRHCGAVQLTPDGRKAVLRAYERRMCHEVRHPVFGYRISYRRVLDVQTRLLAAHLLGELPEYVAFTTR